MVGSEGPGAAEEIIAQGTEGKGEAGEVVEGEASQVEAHMGTGAGDDIEWTPLSP